MNNLPATIAKDPVLKPAEDYYRLRQEGIEFIAQMGSQLWTDYNTHDPGITILDALCYAITDLAYRTGWDLKDILTSSICPQEPSPPFPDQPFFTAQKILTVNPWTPDDFRRLLIDLDAVRNAWVVCKGCACDAYYYAWCKENQLTLSYKKPDNKSENLSLQVKKVEPLGLYDVLLELEADPELGDLNDRKIERRYTIFDNKDNRHNLTLELRFPEWEMKKWDEWKRFLDSAPSDVKVTKFGATKTYNVLNDETLDEDGRDKYLRDNWRNVLYVSFEITPLAAGKTITIENVALGVFGNTTIKNQTKLNDLISLLAEKSELGFVQRYRSKRCKVQQAVADAKTSLYQHRNLDEDYCHIRVVDVEAVAVCADVEVAPGVDIKRVQAEIWFRIEHYFNPPVRFSTLQELLDDGVPVEEIFNGPCLENGFIKSQELATASLKTELRTSDISNLLMDIDGVKAVNNLLLSSYDAEGNVIVGAADPTWNETTSTPIFDNSKVSAAWVLFVSPMHQPRLYHNQSRFLFYQNGLTFPLRMDEASDTLMQLRGEAERPKIRNGANDLPIPAGTFRSPEEYAPVQYSFPLTYGIGRAGLPANASPSRRAQAKQLKAYLMVFEQLLGNAFAQLAHTADLFSLNSKVDRTYFVQEFHEDVIQGYDEIISGITETTLNRLTETAPEFHERRNRFLDHLMARFGEQFSQYALLFTNQEGQQVALDQLINDKLAFLKAYPEISRERGKAFDYKNNPSASKNLSGLENRISLLLGNLDLQRMIVVEHLLLRPKFLGDALYPVCTDGPCETCGEEDPYSFRLTFVMPGWLDPFKENLEMRDFADRTIRQEIPSHLLGKICWIGDEQFFQQFEAAWNAWLEANAKVDWTEKRLQERVEAILRSSVATDSVTGKKQEDKLCRCAATILAEYGTSFYNWMDTNFKSGKPNLEQFTEFSPSPVTLCPDFTFKPDPAATIEAMLKDRYKNYTNVSYHLWSIVNLLSQLTNTYPQARLHDCDVGSDINPVRLGHTALGS